MERRKSEEPLRERTQEVTTRDYAKLSDGTQVKTEFIVKSNKREEGKGRAPRPGLLPRASAADEAKC